MILSWLPYFLRQGRRKTGRLTGVRAQASRGYREQIKNQALGRQPTESLGVLPLHKIIMTEIIFEHIIQGLIFICTGYGGYKSGTGNSRWKGGKILDKDGYILIYSPQHPHKNALGYVREHRLKMEKVIGRYLSKGEVVHHKDRNKKNNKMVNLTLLSKKEHDRVSYYERIKNNNALSPYRKNGLAGR